MEEALYENKSYLVEVTDDCFDTEANAGYCRGYAIINKATGVTEATSRMFAESRWRADQFQSMIVDLDENEDKKDALTELVDTSDVTLN